LNDKWIKEELLNWRQVKVEIPQERIEEISQIKDPNLVKSKGRPKGQKRILGLYEKLRQLSQKQVNRHFFE